MEQEAAREARPPLLLLARESRGMTQRQLAAAMQEMGGPDHNISRGHVSRAENGWLTVQGERLALYARALNYPTALLCLGEQEVRAGSDVVNSCKRLDISARDLKRIQALLSLTRIQLRALLSGNYPRFDEIGIP